MSEVATLLPLMFVILYFILSNDNKTTHNPTFNSFSNLEAYSIGFSKGIKHV